jgi:hypothetical protein
MPDLHQSIIFKLRTLPLNTTILTLISTNTEGGCLLEGNEVGISEIGQNNN